MGLIDDLKKWAHPYEDEDEEYEDDFAELGSRDTGAFADERPSRRERDRDEDRRNKVVNIHATTQLKVVLVKPERFENASEIADHLKEKRTVVINLEQGHCPPPDRLPLRRRLRGRGQDQEGRGQHLHHHALPRRYHGRPDRRAGKQRTVLIRDGGLHDADTAGGFQPRIRQGRHGRL